MMLITLVTLMLINGADDDIDSNGSSLHIVMVILVVLINMVSTLKHKINEDKDNVAG
jgi:hypothetical protein